MTLGKHSQTKGGKVRSRRVIVTTLAAVILLLGACDRKTVLTLGLPSIIGAAVSDSSSSGTQTYAYVEVDGTRLLPVVAINGETLDLRSYSSSGEYMWGSYWEKYTKLRPGDSSILYVYQSDGTAQSDQQTVPHSPHITSPDSNFVLQEDNSLTLTWAGTAGIDRYELAFQIQYDYGSYSYFSLDTTIVVPGTATSYTLPAATVFPSYVDSVDYGYGYVYVQAVCGPRVGRESKGNITGHGLGYFLTLSEDEGHFYIGSAMRAAKPQPRQTLSERARDMVARFKQTLDNR
jgi:hypothetical protein